MIITSTELKKTFKEYNTLFKTENISSDNQKLSDFGFDSMDIIDILLCIEEKFSIKIPDEDSSKLQTINDFVDYLNSHLK